jgi:AcrR family transcriptional regulator
MTRETSKRPYRMTRRAEQREETRRRIVESAVALHEALGPARTPMSAVAEHAGVRRSTLYRHFPDEAALFAACTAHWAAQNPVPDIEAWPAIDDPEERLRAALAELYAFYERVEGMVVSVFRDLADPAVARQFQATRDYLASGVDVLVSGRPERGRARRRVRGAIGHAIAFWTWHSLVREQGFTAAEAVELMCELVAGAGSRAGAAAPA